MADRYPYAPGANDTGASQEAAGTVSERLGRLQGMVLAAIRAERNGGLTADETAAQLEVDKATIRPRLSELRRKGLITDSGIRRQNVSGRKAIVWADGREVDYFGLCPECHSGDGFLNVGRTHVFLCHSHRVKWIFGANIFSSWRWESEADWERNAQLLAGYREVVPFCWPETLKAAADEYPIYENEGMDAGDFPF